MSRRWKGRSNPLSEKAPQDGSPLGHVSDAELM